MYLIKSVKFRKTGRGTEVTNRSSLDIREAVGQQRRDLIFVREVFIDILLGFESDLDRLGGGIV